MGPDKDKIEFFPLAVLLLMALVIGFMPLPWDPDLWFHLADGEYILAHKAVPKTDPFSFTATGQLWVPHSWLFDVGAVAVWRNVGPRAAEAGMAVVFMVAIVISFSILVNRGVNPIWAVAICLGLAIAAGNTRGIRPQVFSLLLCNLVIFLLVKHQYRPRLRLLVYLPVVFLVWAQIHGAAVMGLIVAGVWLAGRVISKGRSNDQGEDMASKTMPCHPEDRMKGWREVLIGVGALGLSVITVLMTPHQINLFQYLALTMKLGALAHTQEWQVPRLLPVEKPDIYLYLLIAGVMVLLGRSGRRVGWAPMGVCVALILLGLTGVRHIPLACIGAVPLIAEALANGEEFSVKQISLSWKSFAATVGIALVLLGGLWRYPMEIHKRYASREAVNGVKALCGLQRPLRVFTTHNTGSYVLFGCPKFVKVFIDSRPDVYGDKIFNEALAAMNGRGWEEIFTKWKIEAVVLQRQDKLTDILSKHTEWKVLANDTATVTFIRTEEKK